MLGLSFKPGIDDLRDSPILSLIRDLWQDGIDVLVHDPDVNSEEMLGSNLAYLEQQLPQINNILLLPVRRYDQPVGGGCGQPGAPRWIVGGRFKETLGTPKANDKT